MALPLEDVTAAVAGRVVGVLRWRKKALIVTNLINGTIWAAACVGLWPFSEYVGKKEKRKYLLNYIPKMNVCPPKN